MTTEVVNRNPKGTNGVNIALIGGADQAVGVTVGVPFTFTTYTQAVSALGATTSNGSLIEMIYAAFLNGAQDVTAVVAAVTGAPSALAYQQSLATLRSYPDIDVVVVEATDATVAGYVETHVDFMATESQFVRGYVGLPTGSSLAAYTARAATINNDRVFVCGPNFKDVDGNEVAGGITAAALAVVAEKEADPALPVNSSAVQGFYGIYLNVFDSDYDTLHNGGVFTATDRGADQIMRYLTSAASGTNVIKEGTISKIRDFVAENMKSTLESEFRRRKLTTSTVSEIKARIISLLSGWKTNEIVSADNSTTVVVTRDTVDLTKVIVNVSYYPVYPLNFIDLKLTLNL